MTDEPAKKTTLTPRGIHFSRRADGLYQLESDPAPALLPWRLPEGMRHEGLIELYNQGDGAVLQLRAPFAWNGATRAVDTVDTLRASALHDALCHMINCGLLPASYQKRADQLYRRELIKAGMWRVRAWWHYAGLRVLGPFHRAIG